MSSAARWGDPRARAVVSFGQNTGKNERRLSSTSTGYLYKFLGSLIEYVCNGNRSRRVFERPNVSTKNAILEAPRSLSREFPPQTGHSSNYDIICYHPIPASSDPQKHIPLDPNRSTATSEPNATCVSLRVIMPVPAAKRCQCDFLNRLHPAC